MKKRILISAGESSGDLHGSNLVKELTKLYPSVEFFGIGCDKMQATGVKLITRMDKHAIIGLLEVFANLNFIRKLFRKFSAEIKREKVDLAILIDYPGFNLALAKILHKNNIPCIYYVTPQIWAWGMWRIRKMRKLITKAIVILKFEESLYKKGGIDASFVGHPLLDELYTPSRTEEVKSSLGLDPDKFTIGLLPGSRPLEITRILPVLLKASILIKDKKNVQFMISRSPNVDKSIYENIYKPYKTLNARFIEGNIHKCLNACDFLLTASGSVTLQAAIQEKPMIITYILSTVSYILIKIVARIPWAGLVNIIAGKEIVPEIIQFKATPKRIAQTTLDLISSEKKLSDLKNELKIVKESLGKPGASKKAAEIIVNYLKSPIRQL